MTATDRITEAQDRVLESVEATQDRVLELNRTIAEGLTSYLPSDRMRVPSMPGVAAFPSPTELVDTSFDWACWDTWVASQRPTGGFMLEERG